MIPGNYTGADINTDYIEYSASRFDGEFMTMDATCLDFSNNSLDVVFNVGLCHYIDDSLVYKGVLEWLHVLRPGGRLILVDAIMPLSRWNLSG